MRRYGRWAACAALLAACATGLGAQEVRGRVWSADAAPVAGLRVTLEGAARSDTATTDSAGVFILPRPAGDSLRLTVDAADSTMRVFHPAVVPLRRAELDAEPRLVLVPRVWTVEGGRHAGSRVSVSPKRAFAPTCSSCSGGFFRHAYGAARHRVPAWPGTSFPLRVAFDHGYSVGRITERDSAAFWREIAELESDAGLDIFRPAPSSEAEPEGNGPEDVVLVWVEAEMPSLGFGSVIYDARGNIALGSVRLRGSESFTRGDTPGLIAHEMLHTLGLGHTCAWQSLMADGPRCPER
ncbi:MAG TPA: hypothetical protein VF625_13235, partial [Longimicrobium sp.]